MGGQKCVAGFYEELAKKTKLSLVVARENNREAATDIQVQPFLYHHRMGYANILHLFKLKKLIRQEKIDLIIIEHSYLGWLGYLLKCLTGKKFLIRSHNIEAHRFRDSNKIGWQIYEWYEKHIHALANYSFFITEDDYSYAITHWKIDPLKCSVLSCGTSINYPTSKEEKQHCKARLISEHNLVNNTRLFFFNGSFDFMSNTDALRIILNEIIPILNKSIQNYRIIICGRWLDQNWVDVLNNCKEIIYKGFVQDIAPYFKGSDCFINPVTLGSGIKVKMIDALSYNLTVISTRFAAKGMDHLIAGDKLLVVEDYQWQSFADAMSLPDLPIYANTSEQFYERFQWSSIVQKALLSLQRL